MSTTVINTLFQPPSEAGDTYRKCAQAHMIKAPFRRTTGHFITPPDRFPGNGETYRSGQYFS